MKTSTTPAYTPDQLATFERMVHALGVRPDQLACQLAAFGSPTKLTRALCQAAMERAMTNPTFWADEYSTAARAYWSLLPAARRAPGADADMRAVSAAADAAGVDLDVVALSEAARLAVIAECERA